VRKKLGGVTAGTADPMRAEGYPTPYDIMLAYKAGGGRRKGGTFRVMAFAFLGNHYA